MAVVFCGVFFRLTNLGTKDYWRDEAQTSLSISGYTKQEVIRELEAGSELSFQDLKKYQQINPEKGIGDTLSALADEEPEHSPLYYGLVWLWSQLFGDSDAAIRSFSAIVSIIALAAVYWLGAQLFQTSLSAWLAVVLMAASPFHVLYAQEAREYSLWTFIILLSCGAFLRAMRRLTRGAWALYTITAVLGLYSHPFFVLVIIAHFVYCAALTRGFGLSEPPFRKPLVYLVTATAIALLAFLPWAILIFKALPTLRENTAWASFPVDFLTLSKRWLIGFSSVFIDTNGDHQVARPAGSAVGSLLAYARQLPLATLTGYLIRVPMLPLIGYSLVAIYRRTPKRVGLFIVTLFGTPVILLMLPDLVLGRGQSSPARYLIPCYLGAQLSVAYLLIDRTRCGEPIRRMMWRTLTVALVLAGLVSCGISSRADTWWNKGTNNPIPQIARQINQSARPVLMCSLSSVRLYDLLSLSHRLSPSVRLRIISQEGNDIRTDAAADLFLLNPSKALMEKLKHEKAERIEVVYIP